MSSSKSRNSNSSDFLNDECDDESFLLDWNNHTFSMTSSLSLIRERQDFVDVTIVAGQNDTSNDDEDDEQDEDIESRHCISDFKSSCDCEANSPMNVAQPPNTAVYRTDITIHASRYTVGA